MQGTLEIPLVMLDILKPLIMQDTLEVPLVILDTLEIPLVMPDTLEIPLVTQNTLEMPLVMHDTHGNTISCARYLGNIDH